MPNHVFNRLEFDCSQERMREILEAICYDGNSEEAEMTGIGTIDFNKIKPMPASLDIESGSRTVQGIDLYLTSLNPDAPHFGTEKMERDAFDKLVSQFRGVYSFQQPHPCLSEEQIAQYTQYNSAEELLTLGKTAVENKLQHGATTWYEWRTDPDHWNTKWNSYYPGEYDGGKEITFQTAWCPPHPIIQRLSEMYPDVVMRHAWANEDLCADAGELYYKAGQEIDGFVPTGVEDIHAMSERIWGFEPDEMEDVDIE